MPNRKNKKAAQMKLLGKVPNEKKALLPSPSQPPITPPRRQAPPRRQPPARRQPPLSSRRQTSPSSPPPPPSSSSVPPNPKEMLWQPLSSSSPKVKDAKTTPGTGESPETAPEEDPAPSAVPYQANRDWRVLRNHFLPHGTTIEMMYTGEEFLPEAEEPEKPEEEVEQQQEGQEQQQKKQPQKEQPQQQQKEQKQQQQPEKQEQGQSPPQSGPKPSFPRIEARPGITHAKVHLPAGVLPTTNCLPDMSAYINAIDFFAHPDRHQPDPNAGPRTTVTVTPKALMAEEEQKMAACSSTMEVVPLGTYQGPPLEPGFLNMAFQTFSTMDFKLDTSEEAGSSDPNRTAYNAEISPTLMLTMHQQHRLQAAVLQDEEPLADALMPIVQDIRKEYAEMRQPAAVLPLPHTTMEFFSGPEEMRAAPLVPRDGGFRSEPRSPPVSAAPGFGAPRMVLLPTPRVVPIPNFRNPPQRYPVFVQPNINPGYGLQGPAPRYPGLFIPNYSPSSVQQPPRYPVFLQPRVLPGYGLQPPRYPVFLHPNCLPNYQPPAPRPYFNQM